MRLPSFRAFLQPSIHNTYLPSPVLPATRSRSILRHIFTANSMIPAATPTDTSSKRGRRRNHRNNRRKQSGAPMDRRGPSRPGMMNNRGNQLYSNSNNNDNINNNDDGGGGVDVEQLKDAAFYGHHIRKYIAYKTNGVNGKAVLHAVRNGKPVNVKSLVNKQLPLTQVERQFCIRGESMLRNGGGGSGSGGEGTVVDERLVSYLIKQKESIVSTMRDAQRNGHSKLLKDEFPEEDMVKRDTTRVFSAADWELYDRNICRFILRVMKVMCDEGTAFRRYHSFSGPEYEGATITAAVNLNLLVSQLDQRCGVSGRRLKPFVSQFPHLFTVVDNGNVIFTGYNFRTDQLSVNSIPLLTDIKTVEALLSEQNLKRISIMELEPFQTPPKNEYPIQVTERSHEVDQWLEKHLKKGVNAVALDCEWDCIKVDIDDRQSNTKPLNAEFPDTIQIATETGCLIYSTCEGKSAPSAGFMALLSNEAITKLWYSSSEDVRLLRKWFAKHNKDPKFVKFLDLQSTNSTTIGLDLIVILALNKRLTKNSDLQFSRWSRKQLQADQIVYAAEDAYAILQVYNKFGTVVKFDANVLVSE